MKKLSLFLSICLLFFYVTSCKKGKEGTEVPVSVEKTEMDAWEYGNFESQIAYGEHLVTILDCNVCHTPKKMSDKGPVMDMERMLSGRPADRPNLDIDRKEVEAKGLTVTGDLTEWAGPWGVSYAGNLTPHETGIGTWTEEQFFLAMKEGKYKGLPGSRTLLPPMPWESFSHMTDDELKAIFAYLKSIKPVENLVPAPQPPLGS